MDKQRYEKISKEIKQLKEDSVTVEEITEEINYPGIKQTPIHQWKI